MIESNDLRKQIRELEACLLEKTRDLTKQLRHSLCKSQLNENISCLDIIGEKVRINCEQMQEQLEEQKKELVKQISEYKEKILNELIQSQGQSSFELRQKPTFDKENHLLEARNSKRTGHLKMSLNCGSPINLLTPIAENSQEAENSKPKYLTPNSSETELKRLIKKSDKRTFGTHNISIFDFDPVEACASASASADSETFSPSSDITPIMASFLEHDSFIEQFGGSIDAQASTPLVRNRSSRPNLPKTRNSRKKATASMNVSKSVLVESSDTSIETSANSTIGSTRPSRRAKENVTYKEPPESRKIRQGDPFWCRK